MPNSHLFTSYSVNLKCWMNDGKSLINNMGMAALIPVPWHYPQCCSGAYEYGGMMVSKQAWPLTLVTLTFLLQAPNGQPYSILYQKYPILRIFYRPALKPPIKRKEFSPIGQLPKAPKQASSSPNYRQHPLELSRVRAHCVTRARPRAMPLLCKYQLRMNTIAHKRLVPLQFLPFIGQQQRLN